MPKIKIVILGAGSFFTSSWIRDMLHIPDLRGTFALVDTDPERLSLSHRLAEKIIGKMKRADDWQVNSSTERKELMEGADYLINTIEVFGLETVRYDYEIPLKYGVDQCIGDTTGPGGIMKAFRTIPAWLAILKDTEKLCPNALVLNYTNPMSMMVLAAQKTTDLQVAGLCHSVQGTSRQLAEYAEIPYEEMKWECGGINHMSWFVKLTHNGRDLYPILREKARNPGWYRKDPVRFEVMLQLGYFPTESSGHFSEYVPYFRKRPELIDRYCGEGYLGERGFYAKNWPQWRRECDDFIRKWLRREEIAESEIKSPYIKMIFGGTEGINLTRSQEYASYIIEAHTSGKPFIIHGNTLNRGLIENLPQDGVVEVPIVVDGNGFKPCYFGRLPEQLAAIDRAHMAVYNLAVDAVLEGDREKAIRAFMLDPLTAAVCSLEEIRRMAEELFEAERKYIPDFLTK